MKKVILGFLSIIFLGQLAVAQPVSDHAIIPMGITIQSVMRLNVKSGGNIEFVFNKILDLTNGIDFSTAYETKFDISASQRWNLLLGTDNGTFIGENAGTITLGVVHFWCEETGTGAANTAVNPLYISAVAAGPLLQNLVAPLITPQAALSNVGGPLVNAFTIHWNCGVLTPMPAVPADRYTVNVFLTMVGI